MYDTTTMREEDLRAREAEAAALAVGGHAILLDEVRDSENKLISVRVHHYLTCRACAANKEKEDGDKRKVEGVQGKP